jgi:hypothetical protein
LRVEFIYPDEVNGEVKGGSRSSVSSSSQAYFADITNPVRNTISPTSYSQSEASQADRPPEQLFSELQNLKNKYDEVIAYTVHLTAERDTLCAKNDEIDRELRREIARKKDAPRTGKQERAETKKVVQQVTFYV